MQRSRDDRRGHPTACMYMCDVLWIKPEFITLIYNCAAKFTKTWCSSLVHMSAQTLTHWRNNLMRSNEQRISEFSYHLSFSSLQNKFIAQWFHMWKERLFHLSQKNVLHPLHYHDYTYSQLSLTTLCILPASTQRNLSKRETHIHDISNTYVPFPQLFAKGKSLKSEGIASQKIVFSLVPDKVSDSICFVPDI
jgi:hypothetical protein